MQKTEKIEKFCKRCDNFDGKHCVAESTLEFFVCENGEAFVPSEEDIDVKKEI